MFLKRVVKTFFALLGLSFSLFLLYLSPSKVKKKTVTFFPVLDEEELPRNGVKRVDFTYENRGRKIHTKVFIVMSGSGLFALSPICTHLGCLVNWDNNKKEFLCPCHGGKYGIEGDVRKGPPSDPLTRLPIKIREEKVYIGMVL
jgi:cytochrome b6-f complex iron-sulfur subunit